MKKNQKAIFLLVIISLLLTLGACGRSTSTQTMAPIKDTLNQEGEMEVYFLDVGQGDSIYIKAPKGENILIDGGEKRYGQDVVNYLKGLGVDHIDIMVATHPHADHIGGLITVLNDFEVKSVYAPRISHTTRTYEEFVLAVQDQELKFKEAKAGVELEIERVNASFVGPVDTYGDHLNNWSGVLKIEYGETSFLLTGDAELKAEADMVSSGQNIKSTVLKLGHHGSTTSSSNEFLDQVQPQYGIVSAGIDNKYGHPEDETLMKMNDRGIEIYRTDLQGTIIASSDGQNVVFNVDSEPVQIEEDKEEKESGPAEFSASVNDPSPKQSAGINLLVSGVEGTPYTATLHYKSKDTVYEGTVGSPLSINIGRAAKEFEVLIDIDIDYKREKYELKTAFTPN